MAEKKRSCKSTATLPTLTPATPCCPSFPPLPPPAASQHHFASRASQGCSLHDKFLLFHLRFYQWNLPGNVFNLFVFPPCVKLVLPSKLRCGPQRGITITKAHVRMVLSCRDSCGRNLTLASLFLPSCGYLKRRATTLGRPCWPPLCSLQMEPARNRKLP